MCVCVCVCVCVQIQLGNERYNNTNRVCKLKKALYGLMQSLRAWFAKFLKTMKIWGEKNVMGIMLYLLGTHLQEKLQP